MGGEERVDGRHEGGRLSRARERLMRWGPAALDDTELLGLLLSSRPSSNAQGLADALLALGGGLKTFVHLDPHELCGLPGLGATRALAILAALELGRRIQTAEDRRARLCTAEEIYRHLRPTLSALKREQFHVLAFNCRNVLVHEATVAHGTVSACPVDPREVFGPAITHRASAVVLAHNHPSGDPEPSDEDLALTRQLVEAGRLLHVRVLDHLIIGDGRYVSLLARGQLAARAEASLRPPIRRVCAGARRRP